MTDTPARPARSRSIIALIIDKLVALCAVIPYALVALGLRFVMARVFFLSGQSKIEGPRVPINLNLRGLEDLSVVLPTAIKPSTFQMFETEYANLPLPPTVATYLFTYAEFVLPVCLIIGFATRFSALGLEVDSPSPRRGRRHALHVVVRHRHGATVGRIDAIAGVRGG